MKKNRKRIIGLLTVFLPMLILTGCGGTSKEMASEEMMVETAAYDAAAYDNGSGYVTDDIYVTEEAGAEAGGESVQVQDPARKLIKTVSMNVETEDFDTLLKTVTEKTEKLGGYVEASNTYNGSYYYGNDSRNANLTLRIPAESLSEFLSAVAENSNVISRDENVTDVTLQYVDMKSHKEALQAQQARLLELLEQAESVEDIITIESRLSEVRYQIESMESQLRTMDNQVSYSTVYLYIEEVARLTPVKEQNTWEKISTGFAESLYQVGNGIRNFFIGLIIKIPYLVVWAVLILVVVFIAKIILKGKKKRREDTGRKEEKAQYAQITEEKQQKEDK